VNKAHYESTVRLLNESKLKFTEIKTSDSVEILFPNGTSRTYNFKQYQEPEQQ